MMDTYASMAWVMTSIPEAEVRPLGWVIMLSASTIAMLGHQLVVSQGPLGAGLLIGDDGEGGNLGAGYQRRWG